MFRSSVIIPAWWKATPFSAFLKIKEFCLTPFSIKFIFSSLIAASSSFHRSQVTVRVQNITAKRGMRHMRTLGRLLPSFWAGQNISQNSKLIFRTNFSLDKKPWPKISLREPHMDHIIRSIWYHIIESMTLILHLKYLMASKYGIDNKT